MQENKLFNIEYNSIYHIYFIDVLNLLKNHGEESMQTKIAFKQAMFNISKYKIKKKLGKKPVHFYISFEDRYFFIISNFQFPKLHLAFFEENHYIIDEIQAMGYELFDTLSRYSWKHMPFYDKSKSYD
jgi:hypothetical protein